MKRIFFYGLAIISAITANAQDVEVKWVENTKRVIGVSGDNRLIYQPDDIVEKLNKYDFPVRSAIKYYNTRTKTYASVYGVLKKEKKFEVNFYEVVDGKLVTDGRNVVSDNFSPVLFGNNGDRDVSGMYQSDDKEVFANISVNSIVDDSKPEQWNITVFDGSLKSLWKQSFNPGYTDKDVELTGAVVSNTGNVLLMGKVAKPGKIDKNEELLYEYKCWLVSSDKQQKIDVKLEGDKQPLDLIAKGLDDDAFVVAGVYTVPPIGGDLKRASGSFIFTLSDSGIKEKKTYAFDSKTIAEAGGADVINRLQSVMLSKFDDGTFMLTTCEQYSVSSSTSSASWYTYHTHDIVNIGFDNKLGKSFETLLKNNFETRGINSDIGVYATGNKLLILYNKDTGRNYRFKTALLNSSGKVEVEKEWAMPDDGRKEYQAYPASSMQISNNKILLNSIMNVEYGPNAIVTIKQ